MAFWLTTTLTALAIVAILAVAMLRRRTGGAAPGEQFDMQIYRDQLDEVERDLGRGTLNPDEAERARTEISRRLLAADRAAKLAKSANTAPRAATYTAISLSALVIIGGGFALYNTLGVNVPGRISYGDMPLSARIAAAAEARESRASQSEIEAALPAWSGPPAAAPADYLELVEELRQAVAQNPDDLKGLELLSLHEGRLGNYVAAHQAMARVLELKGEEARAQDYALYADILVLAANGEVSPEAELALRDALRLDPQNHVARYYSGLMFAQIGRPDLAFGLWRDLLADSPPDALWLPPVRAQIGQLAAMAGVDYTPPEPPAAPSAADNLTGPSPEDMAAAAQMSDEERAVMVQNMVRRLSERLANQGGNAREWAQLISALATLGENERAAAIWLEAQGVFSNKPDELAIIRSMALRAGLAEAGQGGGEAPSGPEGESEQEHLREIDNMVTNLSDRLATEGGPPEDWARLITALDKMGEADRAASVWAEAQKAFAANPEQLEAVAAAARLAGITE